MPDVDQQERAAGRHGIAAPIDGDRWAAARALDERRPLRSLERLRGQVEAARLGRHSSSNETTTTPRSSEADAFSGLVERTCSMEVGRSCILPSGIHRTEWPGRLLASGGGVRRSPSGPVAERAAELVVGRAGPGDCWLELLVTLRFWKAARWLFGRRRSGIRRSPRCRSA